MPAAKKVNKKKGTKKVTKEVVSDTVTVSNTQVDAQALLSEATMEGGSAVKPAPAKKSKQMKPKKAKKLKKGGGKVVQEAVVEAPVEAAVEVVVEAPVETPVETTVAPETSTVESTTGTTEQTTVQNTESDSSKQAKQTGAGKKIRSFKVLLPNSENYEGRFTGLTPYQAANKALSKYYRENKNPKSEIRFSIKESTRGSKRSTYTYNGKREKLKIPVQYSIDNGKTIVKNFKNRLTKIKKAELAKLSL
uniref:Uncharacterized protein n=1 Tax=Megaviridae environmental sample TaxID=1737588 RepID=A0A5J6VM42_9VIRU|nr:MAG: hypothetical protein [Megaviridae environmental sample]